MFELKKAKKSLFVLGLTVGMVSSVSISSPVDAFFGSKKSKNDCQVSSKENSLQFEVDSKGVLTSYKGNAKEIVIPKNVKSIGFGVFMERSEIEKIVLPEGLEEIDEYAFYSCTSLKEIIVPNKVQRIGRLAFGDCTGCKKITLGANVKTIEEFVFWGCNSLDSIDVNPSNTKYSSHQGLLYDKELTDLKACPAGKQGTLELPESVRVISTYAFFDCKDVEKICRAGSNPMKIEVAAFYGCKHLTSLDFADKIEKIGACAFAECKSLTEFTIGENVRSLGSSAFIECKSLKKVTFIPKELTLGHDLFASCPQTVIIIADKDSVAASYANRHSDKLVLV